MEQKVKAVFAAHPDGQETAARIARAYLAAGMEVLKASWKVWRKIRHWQWKKA